MPYQEPYKWSHGEIATVAIVVALALACGGIWLLGKIYHALF